MTKEGFITKYGKEEYVKKMAKIASWRKEHNKLVNKRYHEAHPQEYAAHRAEQNRKGGKYYEKRLKNEHTGLRGERNKARMRDSYKYCPYKAIIAPESQIHHEWIQGTADYRGAALVEKDQHMHGVIDVIEILKGKITLLTEEEIRSKGRG